MPAESKRDTTPPPAGKPSAAETAKAALRRLALAKLEPTPENYARAWVEEGGPAPAAEPVSDPEADRELAERAAQALVAQAQSWTQTIEKLARGLERGGRQWTMARKKDSLKRVLDGNRNDLARLQTRLNPLLAQWEGDSADDTIAVDEDNGGSAAQGSAPPVASASATAPASAASASAVPSASAPAPSANADWPPVLGHYDAALRSALPAGDERADELGTELRKLLVDLQRQGATATLLQQAEDICSRARRLLAHRHHLVDELHRLTQEMGAGMAEVAEDGSWVKGQSESLAQSLGDAPNVRSVRAASEMLAQTRARQQVVREERDRARVALRGAIQQMLSELDALGDHTGNFTDSLARYVDTVAHADSLESLAGVVRQMVDESRAVHGLVGQTRDRLRDGHEHVAGLEAKVQALEIELRRLSDEVSTDALTEIANRRGLTQAFDVETARLERQGGELAIGLLDIDNFKKLNDTLGHSVGDTALKTLAGHVQKQLRPVDVVARFGGEEFVVLLPGTEVGEAQVTLTRLQRTLSASLFMHDGREVFVTFSAGVTRYRPGEPLGTALERADEALYEAKRTGKNRTCIG